MFTTIAPAANLFAETPNEGCLFSKGTLKAFGQMATQVWKRPHVCGIHSCFKFLVQILCKIFNYSVKKITFIFFIFELETRPVSQTKRNFFPSWMWTNIFSALWVVTVQYLPVSGLTIQASVLEVLIVCLFKKWQPILIHYQDYQHCHWSTMTQCPKAMVPTQGANKSFLCFVLLWQPFNRQSVRVPPLHFSYNPFV